MKKSANGDCYKVHYMAYLEGVPGLLCHGTVWHPDTGWHGHCWIELNEDTVMDLSNGHNAAVGREIYYSIGKVKDVKKYGIEQALKQALKEGTYGPWDMESK